MSGVESWVEVLTVACAGRNGNVRGSGLLRYSVGERRMRAYAVLAGPLGTQHGAGLRQRHEQRLVQALGIMEEAHLVHGFDCGHGRG